MRVVRYTKDIPEFESELLSGERGVSVSDPLPPGLCDLSGFSVELEGEVGDSDVDVGAVVKLDGAGWVDGCGLGVSLVVVDVHVGVGFSLVVVLVGFGGLLVVVIGAAGVTGVVSTVKEGRFCGGRPLSYNRGSVKIPIVTPTAIANGDRGIIHFSSLDVRIGMASR